MYVDLGAEKLIAAAKDHQLIAVEVKTFNQPSLLSEFYRALGQFISYRLALQEIQPERELYLAVPEDVYETFFRLLFTQKAVQQNKIKLIIYDGNKEVIKEWIK